MIRTEALDLPVRTALPALREALGTRGGAVLSAPPGTGKTTLVPLALAGLLADGQPSRILVAEPRRMAVRAAARRMAWLLGEECGQRIGFTVRGERRVGPRTVLEVVTTGVLLQRLHRDPELPGVDAVLLDECHERHLEADTAMAFLLEARATLRPELRLVAASATTDTAAWSALMGGVPVVGTEPVGHPVETVWAPPARPARPPHGTWVDPALLDHVAAVVRRALRERDGDVLCFLPGAGEIARVGALLGSPPGVDVVALHGRMPAADQDAALSPGTRRRVLLATAVAESSLTVPGVRTVVDAGLAREPRTDHARGLGSLTTVEVSRASAAQRAGRAGREGPGAVYRCWTPERHARAPRDPSPQIAIADLTAFALQAACWGDPSATGLALLDPPPPGPLAAAHGTLRAIGALTADGRPTARGRRMAGLGVHPRLARALLDGAEAAGVRPAAEVVALLSEEPPREFGDDLAAVLRAARGGGDGYPARWRAEVRRLTAAAGRGHATDRAGQRTGGGHPDAVAGLVAALAFPERVARRRGGDHLMASGTAARTGAGTGLAGAEWIAVAVADRTATSASARVRLAAVIDEDTARRAAGELYERAEEVSWAGGDVVAREVERLGAIELRSRPLRDPDPLAVRAALLEGLRAEGLGVLRWSREAHGTRERMAFLHRELGAPWPDVADEALLPAAPEWLGPELAAARRRSDLERVDAGGALARLLPWATGEASRFAELAPERVEVPSGSRIRIDYTGPQPVLAVRLQELFGLRSTPRVAGGRVPLLVHLLSPAGRPAAVTADLESFWRDGYRAVRAQLRGRYPRHAWPEDPTTAEPTRRTAPRRTGPKG